MPSVSPERDSPRPTEPSVRAVAPSESGTPFDAVQRRGTVDYLLRTQQQNQIQLVLIADQKTNMVLTVALLATLGADLAQQAHDLPRGLGVQAGGGLVDEQDLGLLRQRAGDADTLALAAGEGVCALVDVLAQAHPVQQPTCSRS